jgi:hypothetical protein
MTRGLQSVQVSGENPRALILGDRRVEVTRLLDRWRGEDNEFSAR